MKSATTITGVVLRTFPLREADLIVSILSVEEGKMRAVAKGVRRSRRRFLGGIDLFDSGAFELQPGKSANALPSIAGLERDSIPRGLREDFTALSLASLSLELADVFAHVGDPSAGELVPPLRITLDSLGTASAPREKFAAAIRFFLEVFRIGGVDPLASTEIINGELRDVLQNPTSADDSALRPALRRLIGYAEQVAGKRLLTAAPELYRLG